ncbi:Vba5p [Sugiyamaella lignohabitans]|uniref:Vba5p n=1 Tax=Sugiyamaella lignohabitans TaxID=796027 RepID=A0A167FRY2_9ASCO|nr:Vba5p [Sugiyamaella lignohabitans]ANB15625.1 Vba5p [Sugiyamaella lignohabitans]
MATDTDSIQKNNRSEFQLDNEVSSLSEPQQFAPELENNDEEAQRVRTHNTIEDAGDGTKASDQLLHGVPLILCAVSLLLCMFLVALDQTIIVTLLSTVGNKFGDFGKISWISSGFLLPTAILAMNWGKISLIFGRKYTMLVAIILFEVGSLICALCNSMDMLIGGRVIAGIGGGGIQVMVFVILTEIVSIEKRGIIQGLVAISFAVASVVGPLVGGAFTEHVSFRWCFYINLPIGGVAFACIWWFFNPPLPKGTLKEKLLKIDYIGTVLLAVGLVLVLLALTFGSISTPWNSALVISFFTIGGVVVVAFIAYNFSLSKNPLLPWVVVRVWRVDVVCVAFFMTFGSFMAAVLYLSTFFQVVLNADAMHSGIDLLPMIIPVVLCSASGGIFISKTGITKPIAIAGAVFATVGFGLCSLLDEHSSSSKRIGYLIVPGIGVGLSFQSLTLNAQLAAPKQNGGVLIATSMIAFSRSIGGVIGSTVGQTIQSVSFKTSLKEIKGIPSTVDLTQLVNSPELIRTLPQEVQGPIIQAFIKAFHRVMYFAIAMAGVAFITELFFTNQRIPIGQKQGPPAPAQPDTNKLEKSDSMLEPTKEQSD